VSTAGEFCPVAGSGVALLWPADLSGGLLPARNSKHENLSMAGMVPATPSTYGVAVRIALTIAGVTVTAVAAKILSAPRFDHSSILIVIGLGIGALLAIAIPFDSRSPNNGHDGPRHSNGDGDGPPDWTGPLLLIIVTITSQALVLLGTVIEDQTWAEIWLTLSIALGTITAINPLAVQLIAALRR
jgi:hypothetical protein